MRSCYIIEISGCMCICVWEKVASEHAGVYIWVHVWRDRSRMLNVFFCHPPCCLETESLITVWTGPARHGGIRIYLSLSLTAKDTGTCSCVWSLTWMMAFWIHVFMLTGRWSYPLSHLPCPWIHLVLWSGRKAQRLAICSNIVWSHTCRRLFVYLALETQHSVPGCALS